jgi:hypothetical protein
MLQPKGGQGRVQVYKQGGKMVERVKGKKGKSQT